LRGDLILAAVADEETGGEYGFGWLAKNAPEAILADYAINESGGGPIPTPGGLVYTVNTGEKGRLEAHITLRGKATHAASPWMGDNPAFKLAEVLRRLQAWQPEIDVSGELFAHLPALLGRADPITAQNVDALADELAQVSRNLGSAVRGLSRMTLTPTMVFAGVKSNSVPASCRLVCDVRTLPHQDEAYVRRQIDEVLAGIDGASYELIYTAAPNASPYDTPLTAALQRATALAADRNDLRWLPSLTTGFTDSRLVRPLGIVTYGFSPGHPAADLNYPAGVHGANESSEVATLLFRTKLLLALALDLLG
jgi:acetylornithine deacetylase/succinyl-diaminopimelate desuccinylase-like protein